MQISTIEYKGQLRTEAIHLQSGDVIFTDAPKDNNGEGNHFSPTDLVATALGSCALTIMGLKAKNLEINMSGATASVEKVMGNSPRHISKIGIIIKMPQQEYSDKQKVILINAAKTCPVGASLGELTKIELSIEF